MSFHSFAYVFTISTDFLFIYWFSRADEMNRNWIVLVETQNYSRLVTDKRVSKQKPHKFYVLYLHIFEIIRPKIQIKLRIEFDIFIDEKAMRKLEDMAAKI